MFFRGPAANKRTIASVFLLVFLENHQSRVPIQKNTNTHFITHLGFMQHAHKGPSPSDGPNDFVRALGSSIALVGFTGVQSLWYILLRWMNFGIYGPKEVNPAFLESTLKTICYLRIA